MKKIIIFGLMTFFLMCSCNHKVNKVEKDSSEQKEKVPDLQAQRISAQDSITNLGNKIFSEFSFGMSKSNYEKSLSSFKEETNGYVKIENLKFFLENPAYENNKLTCLTLKACDVIERFNGMYVSTDYASILKERYTNRLGYPDYNLDEDYQSCDPTSETLNHVVWTFENRVFWLSFKKDYIRDGYLAKYYYLNYSTKDYWLNLKEDYNNAYKERQRLKQEKEEKDNKYKDEL